MVKFFIFLALMGMPTLLWSQQAGTPALPSDSEDRCKYGVEHMIAVAEKSLLEPSSRPERTEKRRELVEDWQTRLENGEDPCLLYSDILRASTTF